MDGSSRLDDFTLVSAEALAKRLTVSVRTVYRLQEQGMPAIKLGPRCWRFDLKAVWAWLEARSA